MSPLDKDYNPLVCDLSLRDYIAIEVLPVFINNPETNYAEDAEDAYRVADAMLKQRAKHD
jgi:hypothetical protein